jgi:glutamate carboxypeptidase
MELGRGSRVVLLGHADTVWPIGTTETWPFALSADGQLTGPGVGDMKVCLATAVAALDVLAHTPPAGVGSVTLLVVPDEETGSTVSRAHIERALAASDACLTLEAARPGGGVVTSRGAVGAMVIRATGRARHATDPGHRASALVPLARLVDAIEGQGATVGVLRAGTARQVVPGEGELHVDLRAPTSEGAQSLADRVRSLAQTHVIDGVTIDVSGGMTRPAWPRSAGTVALYAAAETAALALGTDIYEVAERGGSDASFAGALGIPTLDGLGPPCHGSCSPREMVDLEDIPLWGAILCTVIASV